MKNITHRISLMDSLNRAVQIDVDINSLGVEDLQKLLSVYNNLIDSEQERILQIEKEDKKLDQREEKLRKAKIKALPDNECSVCGLKWKGGSDKCPDKTCESYKDGSENNEEESKEDEQEND